MTTEQELVVNKLTIFISQALMIYIQKDPSVGIMEVLTTLERLRHQITEGWIQHGGKLP